MVNVFINIIHIIRIFNKSFGIIKMFQSYRKYNFLFLIKNWYLSWYRSFAYKYILSISGWLFIKFSNAFVFTDPEPPIINILYGWSGIYGQLGLCFLSFSLVYSSKFIIYNCFNCIITFFNDNILKKISKLIWQICCTESLQKLVTLIFLLYWISVKTCNNLYLLSMCSLNFSLVSLILLSNISIVSEHLLCRSSILFDSVIFCIIFSFLIYSLRLNKSIYSFLISSSM